MEFLLNMIKMQIKKDALSQTILSTKQLLMQINALCTAKGMLEASDYVTITMVMKNAKVPPHIKSSSAGKQFKFIFKKKNFDFFLVIKNYYSR